MTVLLSVSSLKFKKKEKKKSKSLTKHSDVKKNILY